MEGEKTSSIENNERYVIKELYNEDRPTWTQYFKEIVILASKRSLCPRLQVGALFVKENRIIAQGYNGFLPGAPHKSVIRDGHEQAMLHAEQNLIVDCAKRGISMDGSTAYVTHYPCIICCRLMLAGGIKEIRYINDYKNDDLVEYLCSQQGVGLVRI